MPAIIGRQNNSYGDALNALFSIPLQIQQNKQNQNRQALATRTAESTIDRNTSAADLNRQKISTGQQQQLALDSPELAAAINSLFTPGADGQIQPTGLDALFRANPKNTLSNVGDLIGDVGKANLRGQVGVEQNASTPTGQANLSALAAGKTLPSPYSNNANGLVLNEITGSQSAPSAPVQEALISQDSAGRSNNKSGNGLDYGKLLVDNFLKSPVIDPITGEQAQDLNSGKPLTKLDQDKVVQYHQFTQLPENQGLDENVVAGRFMELLTGNTPQGPGGLIDPSSPLAALFGDAQASTQSQPQQVQSKEQLDALPSGALYVGPDGITRVKP